MQGELVENLPGVVAGRLQADVEAGRDLSARRGSGAAGLPVAVPGAVLLEGPEAEQAVGAGAVPGGALGLEAAAGRHVDGLLDGAGALGTVAEVVLDPLAMGGDVG